MRVTVDPDKCCGAGQCVTAAPAVFDHDEQGVSFVANQPGEEEYANVRAARLSCPTGAVAIVED
jgi:ferredoxin